MPTLRSALRVAVLLAAAVPSAPAQPPGAVAPVAAVTAAPLAGTWNGVLRPGPVALRLALTVRGGPSGTLAGTLTSVDQGNAQLPAAVAVRGDTVVVTVAGAGATYTAVLSAARDSLRGTFAQGGASFPLAFGRGDASAATPAAARPQEPAAPFPYRTEEVGFESAPGVRLAGTLVLPAGPGPVPAVVFVTGSGPQDRDETVFGHRPFLVIADRLARAGIASLRVDDRGVGRSTGEFARATSRDFAVDAEAAVRVLRARPEVARDRVGILGHSEGGLVGPMVAARSRDVAFLVLLAGPGVRGDSLLLLQGTALATASGAPPAAIAGQQAVQRRLFAAVAGVADSAAAARRYIATADSLVAAVPPEARQGVAAALAREVPRVLSPWMREYLAYDPAPALRRVRVPVLALNGTLDRQVPAAENLAAIRVALAAGGNRDHQETALPGLNHLFQPAHTGLPGEYATIPETVAPAALDAVTRWVTARFVSPRP